MELTRQQERGVNLGSIVAAVVLILVALFVLTGSDQAGARYGILLILVVLLVVQVWLVLQARKATQQAREEALPVEEAPVQEDLAGLEEPAQMVIKCKQCGTVFPVADNGVRPLVAACPNCGKSGTIKVKADVA